MRRGAWAKVGAAASITLSAAATARHSHSTQSFRSNGKLMILLQIARTSKIGVPASIRQESLVMRPLTLLFSARRPRVVAACGGDDPRRPRRPRRRRSGDRDDRRSAARSAATAPSRIRSPTDAGTVTATISALSVPTAPPSSGLIARHVERQSALSDGHRQRPTRLRARIVDRHRVGRPATCCVRVYDAIGEARPSADRATISAGRPCRSAARL